MYIYNEIVPILSFSNKVYSLFCFIFLDQMGPAKIAAFNCQPTLHMWSAVFVPEKLPEILRIVSRL